MLTLEPDVLEIMTSNQKFGVSFHGKASGLIQQVWKLFPVVMMLSSQEQNVRDVDKSDQNLFSPNHINK